MIPAHFTLKSQHAEAWTFATQDAHSRNLRAGKPVRAILLIRPDEPPFPPVAPLHDRG
jgi:hypothetical protein